MTIDNPGFESAIKKTPTSKATQTIIPGAAYLSLSEKRVYIGGRFNRLFTDRGKLVYGRAPTDLILLYAPGDKVVPGIPKDWRVVVHKGTSNV